jgi:Tol biopolymer transport system component
MGRLIAPETRASSRRGGEGFRRTILEDCVDLPAELSNAELLSMERLVKKCQRTVLLVAAAAMFGVVILTPVRVRAQNAQKEALRARRISAARAQNIAENFEMNATTLTVFDRHGKRLSTLGPRAMYDALEFSPDGKRLAVVKLDLENESSDIWVIDLATGATTRITSSQRGERARQPVWSPDGGQIAFVGAGGGHSGLYRKASSGQGPEELLYNSPNILVDWSLDGRFLSFFTTGGTLYVLPLEAPGRKPVEVFSSPKQICCGWLSPDSRFIAYTSNESGTNEVYVRPREVASAAPGSGAWKVSDHGGFARFWRRDGKELYYQAADRGIMAVDVSTRPVFKAGKPRLLFRPPEAMGFMERGFPGLVAFAISRDGERIVMEVPSNKLRQITIFDRQGKVVKTVGEPGFYSDPGFSPDGTRLVVLKRDPKTGNEDIWTLDMGTGKTYQVTNDVWRESDPIWSPDGTHIAYNSTRDQYTGIYRKAWDGTGEEELLFRNTPGASMGLSDWSPDGKFLTFSTGAISMVALRPGENALDRKAIYWLRDEFDEIQGVFSPDMRYLVYQSNEADIDVLDVYVRPFDASRPDSPGLGSPVRVSKNGTRVVSWRRDGKEMYFLTRAWEVAAVDVTTTPVFQASTPKILFKLPGPLSIDRDNWKNVTATGEQFVFAIPVK